jgi:hypothetical protein
LGGRSVRRAPVGVIFPPFTLWVTGRTTTPPASRKFSGLAIRGLPDCARSPHLLKLCASSSRSPALLPAVFAAESGDTFTDPKPQVSICDPGGIRE